MGLSTHIGSDLSFSGANTKLQKTAKLLHVKPTEYWSLDLRAGLTCPYAKQCKSVATDNGIVDGKHCQFRCYAATMEILYPKTKALHDRNTNVLKSFTRNHKAKSIANLLERNLPPKCKVIRLHTSGDFFNYQYFLGWIELAKRHPDIRFYCYTKALPLVERYLTENPDNVSLSNGILSPNFRITASYGGTHDYLIDDLNIRSAKVIFDKNETNLPIDNDDSHAALSGGSFALLIHSVQPKNTLAAKAWDKIRRKMGKHAKGGKNV